MKKFLTLILALALVMGLMVPALAVDYGAELNPEDKTYTQHFSDVPTTNWAFTYIEDLVERGAINGFPDGKFYPKQVVTREQFAKIMVVAAGVTATPVKTSSYSDIKVTDWCSPFVEAAKPYMTAYRDWSGKLSFKPKQGALREDMAVAVVKLRGYDTRLADLPMLEVMFSDADTISESAKPYESMHYTEVGDLLETLIALNDSAPKGSIHDLVSTLQADYDKKEREARTFKGNVLQTHDEYQKVATDYETLRKQFLPISSREQLNNARAKQQDGAYHPVARRVFGGDIAQAETEISKQEKAANLEQAKKREPVVNTGYLVVAVCVLIACFVLPILSMNGDNVSFITIIKTCWTYFMESNYEAMMPCGLLVSFSIPSILGWFGSLCSMESQSVHLCAFLLLLTFLIGAAVSATFSCLPTLYVLLAIELVCSIARVKNGAAG